MSAMDEVAAGGPLGRLLYSLKTLLATLVGLAHTRLQLLSTELQEEIYRAAGLLLWALVALLAGAMGLLLASFVLIVAYWDTHRLLVSILVMSGFLAMALAASGMLVARIRSRPPLLEETLAELARDRQRLKANS
jgi:uncharacterized membrane protein YqjE